eukprot:3743852-Prymnesium_polylepis.1
MCAWQLGWKLATRTRALGGWGGHLVTLPPTARHGSWPRGRSPARLPSGPICRVIFGHVLRAVEQLGQERLEAVDLVDRVRVIPHQVAQQANKRE